MSVYPEKLKALQKVANAPSLDDLLESWTVMELDPELGHPEGYIAVVNDEEVVAYFLHDADAFRFRLAEINRILNG